MLKFRQGLRQHISALFYIGVKRDQQMGMVPSLCGVEERFGVIAIAKGRGG